MMLKMLADEKGASCLRTKGLSLLASETVHVTLATAAAGIQELSNSSCFKFVPVAMSGPIMTSLGLVNRVRRGKLNASQFQALEGCT